MADGNTGRVAIMEGGSRDVFENPLDNLSKVHFHSDLDYLTIVQQIDIPFFSMPAIAGASDTYKIKSKKSKGSSTYYTIPRYQGGTRYYNLGAIIGDVDGPILGFEGNAPLASYPLYFYSQGVNMAMRTISLVKRDGVIWLAETWLNLGRDIPAQTINNVKIVKFNLMSDHNPNSPYKLMITPERFIASGGKLDSRARYVKRVPPGKPVAFYMNGGRMMDTVNGGARWWRADGTYIDENGYNGTYIQTLPSVGINI